MRSMANDEAGFVPAFSDMSGSCFLRGMNVYNKEQGA